MKKNITIAIVGNGKLVKALVLGFLLAGYRPDQITIIGRDESEVNSDLSFFEALGVETSRDMRSALHKDYIILAVTPKGMGDTLVRMFNAGIKDQRIISFVSGTNTHDVAHFLNTRPSYIIKGTLNTNVEYCKGIICLGGKSNKEDAAKLFSPLGKVILEKPRRILKSVTSVGAMNAFDTKAIIIAGQGRADLMSGEMSIRRFLKILNEWNFLEPEAGKETKLIGNYLWNKAAILQEYLGYSRDEANERSLLTFKSTVLALLEIKDLTNWGPIYDHIKKVATEGGCTEQGIVKMIGEESLTRAGLKEIIPPTHQKTSGFKREVRASLQKEVTV